jgi:hypothetical protein
MNSKVLKGLFLTLVGVATPILTTSPIAWAVVGITLAGTALTYIGKNAITPLQSTSQQGTFDWKNSLSSILVGVGTAVTSGVATLVVNGAVDVPLLIHTVGGVVGTYVVSTMFEGNKPSAPITPIG